MTIRTGTRRCTTTMMLGIFRETQDARGKIVRYTYDAARRPLTESWGQGSQVATVVRYHYDADLSPLHRDARNTLGRLAYVEDQAGTVFLSYDPRGNIAGQIRQYTGQLVEFVLRMRYDAAEHLVGLTYPDGMTVTLTYNAQGLLESMPGFVDNWDYSAAGQRATISYANSVNTSYEYDSRLRLHRLAAQRSGATLQDITYAYDGAGNVRSMADGRSNRGPANDLTQSFTYDDLHRLTEASGTYGQISHVYDSIGNMLSQSEYGA